MTGLVFVAVVLARFAIPLAIPKFPLPAIVASLVLDAADQTIFAAFGVEPANYQGYDKALDVYYLSIAYLSTIRNWTDGVPFRTSQFLWYYRLVGVVAFELTGARALLILFPNTFEYFFIAYEAVRVCWEPSRLTRRHVLGTAAAIWIFIKLPQEWWIHIARLDVTDVLDRHPWVYGLLGGMVLSAGILGWRRRDRIPTRDWAPSVAVDAHPTTVVGEPADPPIAAWALLNHPLVEKTALVALVSIVFSQILPGVQATTLQLAVAAGVVVVVNAGLSQVLLRLGARWTTMAGQVVSVMILNVAIVYGATYGLRRGSGTLNVGTTLFFLALLVLIVSIYDRYRTLRVRTLVSGKASSDHRGGPATPVTSMPGPRSRG